MLFSDLDVCKLERMLNRVPHVQALTCFSLSNYIIYVLHQDKAEPRPVEAQMLDVQNREHMEQDHKIPYTNIIYRIFRIIAAHSQTL